mmetsp:Transcript_11355/g.12180  ORF Transcript_11355/g.12180 Transcript_11355/m.12180 type:complete len:215 (+) Transcript_11355:198-842(+)
MKHAILFSFLLANAVTSDNVPTTRRPNRKLRGNNRKLLSYGFDGLVGAEVVSHTQSIGGGNSGGGGGGGGSINSTGHGGGTSKGGGEGAGSSGGFGVGNNNGFGQGMGNFFTGSEGNSAMIGGFVSDGDLPEGNGGAFESGVGLGFGAAKTYGGAISNEGGSGNGSGTGIGKGEGQTFVNGGGTGIGKVIGQTFAGSGEGTNSFGGNNYVFEMP